MKTKIAILIFLVAAVILAFGIYSVSAYFIYYKSFVLVIPKGIQWLSRL